MNLEYGSTPGVTFNSKEYVVVEKYKHIKITALLGSIFQQTHIFQLKFRKYRYTLFKSIPLPA